MMRRISFLMTALVLLLTLSACSTGNPNNSATNQTPTQPQKQTKQWSQPPAMKIDPNKTYIAHMETNKGNLSIELFAKDAPKTVNNFVFLAQQHFYDGVIFHRIIKDFMIQTGDPQGTGAGGPGYQFEDELRAVDKGKYTYTKGIVAMANRGPNTNGSQFFICSGPNAAQLSLPEYANYTIFGKVISGMDTVDKIAMTPVEQKNGELSFPKEKVYVKTITIEEK